jgi:hypothetical protein
MRYEWQGVEERQRGYIVRTILQPVEKQSARKSMTADSLKSSNGERYPQVGGTILGLRAV